MFESQRFKQGLYIFEGFVINVGVSVLTWKTKGMYALQYFTNIQLIVVVVVIHYIHLIINFSINFTVIVSYIIIIVNIIVNRWCWCLNVV